MSEMVVQQYPRVYRISMVAAILLALTVGSASARLPDMVSIFTIKTVSALHRPTGCMAKLEFSGTVLLGAAITDPLCLPADVEARAVPAFRRDFHLPTPRRLPVKGR